MYKRNFKRREELEENNKKKRSKNYLKKRKLWGPMVALVNNLDPTILPEGSAKLRWGGARGTGGAWGAGGGGLPIS
jgi:hypothetical protein